MESFVNKLIDVNQPMETDPVRYSTIGILLRGARNLSGRNLSTGVYEQNEINLENFKNGTYYSNLFSGLMNYLILLEQIGSIFQKKPPLLGSRTNSVYLALENFSDLSEEKINAITSLRNSLAHKHGLATEDNAKFRHKFSLDFTRNSNIVDIPVVPWLGDFSDKSEQSSTTIYIFDLLDLIERIYTNLKEEVKNSNVEVILEFEELKSRFTILP